MLSNTSRWLTYLVSLVYAAAAFIYIYIRLFGFAARPGGLAYFAAYLAVGIPLLFVSWKLGTGAAT